MREQRERAAIRRRRANGASSLPACAILCYAWLMPYETSPVVLVATWSDGVFGFSNEAEHHELAGRAVRSITTAPDGSALAIVDGHELYRRASDGTWSAIAGSPLELACCVTLGDRIYVGTDDARLLRLGEDRSLAELRGLQAIDGRASWYAGSAIVNGRRMGPPLGIRSLSGTVDGATLLVNVHVGGIPRSTDGGVTWQPTIDIDADVHEVRVHPTRPDIVMAAAAVGLCSSCDGGKTWRVETEGLHATYCSAVAFVGDEVLVAASSDHFAAQGAIYRRAIDGQLALRAVAGGLPTWLDGIADTGCIAARSSLVAAADRSGALYTSADSARSWSARARALPSPSSVAIC